MLPDQLDPAMSRALPQWLGQHQGPQLVPPELLSDNPDARIPAIELITALHNCPGWQCEHTQRPQPEPGMLVLAFTADGAIMGLVPEAGTAPRHWHAQFVTDDGSHDTPARALDDIVRQHHLVAPLVCLRAQAHSLSGVFVENASDSARDIIWPVFLRHWQLSLHILGAAIALALLAVVTPLGFQAFADKVLPNQATQSLLVLTLLMLIGAAASSLIQCFRDYQEQVLSGRFQVDLGGRVLTRLLAMSQTYFDARPLGDLTKLMEQIDEAAGFLVNQLLAAAIALVSLAVILPLLFSYSSTLATLVLAISLTMALTVGLGMPALQARVRQAYRSDARYQSVLIELFKGMGTIRAMTTETPFHRRTHNALAQSQVDHFRVNRFNTWLSAGVQFQSQLITIAVIFFGAQAVFAQTLTIGQLIAFNMLANHVVQPLISLVMTGQGWASFRLARQKINELQPDTQASADRHPTHDANPAPPDLAGDIRIQHLSFRYPDTERLVLDDLSLHVRAGETLGLVGPSGSGKSTLIQLLMQFYTPETGTLSINGHNLRHWSGSALRQRIALVPQHCFLFNASLADNVRLGRLDASPDAVRAALDDAGCGQFIETLPEREHSLLQEDADNLSGGQRQRIAIARALIRQCDLILFDEATSALDLETEARVRVAMRRACQKRTAIIVAHRLSSLADCDRIAVMDSGRIVALGEHRELMQSSALYRRLWELNRAGGNPDRPSKEASDARVR